MDNLFDKLKLSNSILLSQVTDSSIKNRITFFSSDEDDGQDTIVTKDYLNSSKSKKFKSSILDEDSMGENLQIREETDDENGIHAEENQNGENIMESIENKEKGNIDNKAEKISDKQNVQINGILDIISEKEEKNTITKSDTNSSKSTLKLTETKKNFDFEEDLLKTTINTKQSSREIMSGNLDGSQVLYTKLKIRLKRLNMDILLPKVSSSTSSEAIKYNENRGKMDSTYTPKSCTVRIKRIKLNKIVTTETRRSRRKRNENVTKMNSSGRGNRSNNSTISKITEKNNVDIKQSPTVKRRRGRRSKKEVDASVMPSTSRKSTEILSKLSLSTNQSTNVHLNESSVSNNQVNENRIVNDIVEIDICSSNRINRRSNSPTLPLSLVSHPIRQYQHRLYSRKHYNSYDSPTFSRYIDHPSTSRQSTIQTKLARKVIYNKLYLKQLLEHNANLIKNRKSIILFGKNVFMSHVKLKRPREEDYSHLPSSIRPRKHILKMFGNVKKPKLLTVSFQEQVQIFGDDSSDSAEEDDLENNKDNNSHQPTIDNNDDNIQNNHQKTTCKSEETSEIHKIHDNNLLQSLPVPFQHPYGTDDGNTSQLDTGIGALHNDSCNLPTKKLFMTDDSLITSTPTVKQFTLKRKKPTLSPLKDDTVVSPRQAQLKLANEKLPSKTTLKNLIPHATADSEEDEIESETNVKTNIEEVMSSEATICSTSPVKNQLEENFSETNNLGNEVILKEIHDNKDKNNENVSNEFESIEETITKTSLDDNLITERIDLEDGRLAVEKRATSNSSDSFASAIDNTEHQLPLINQDEDKEKELKLERTIQLLDSEEEEEDMNKVNNESKNTEDENITKITQNEVENIELNDEEMEALTEDEDYKGDNNDEGLKEEEQCNVMEDKLKVIEEASKLTEDDSVEISSTLEIKENNFENRFTNIITEENSDSLEVNEDTAKMVQESANITDSTDSEKIEDQVIEKNKHEVVEITADNKSHSVHNIDLHNDDSSTKFECESFSDLVRYKYKKDLITSEGVVLMEKSEENLESCQSGQYIQDTTDSEKEDVSVDQRNTKISSNTLSENLEELPLKLFVDSSSEAENSNMTVTDSIKDKAIKFDSHY